MDDRIISSLKLGGDEEAECDLRPKWLSDYVGQEKVKEKLSIYIEAAKSRADALDHCILYGPPGLGKTTLAQIIANELGVAYKVTTGPAIERAGDLAAIMTNLNKGDVLFIDEIHRLNRNVEEVLYPAMEDFALDFILGKGPSARSMRFNLEKFTLIGATTKVGMLGGPLRDRFGVVCRLELYTPKELYLIVKRGASILKLQIEDRAAQIISERSRGTPRIANRILKRVRDYCQVKGDGIVTAALTEIALQMMEIDDLGLDFVDKRVLNAIIDKFAGGPVGLETLAASIGEDECTIEDMYEPYLMQIGFVARTTRGRICLPDAYKHLGKTVNTDNAQLMSFYSGLTDSDWQKNS